jgi:hypothetical protein
VELSKQHKKKESHDSRSVVDMLVMEPNRTAGAVDHAAPNAIRVLLVEDDAAAAALARTQVGAGGQERFQVEWKDNLQRR